ncbi:SCO family protein [Salipiger profundus]|uniref:SCO family protein n=1 Tax=Salipiger profundus TaxID=1229727 RepID=UPI001F604567|nr:SCO family protein [Salipiger profundus]
MMIGMTAMVAILVATVTVWLRLADETTLAPDDLGRGEYRLLRMDGSHFTQESLLGAPSLVFFGFTHCPDVCPTTLGDMAGWREDLGAEWERLRVFFVSVDPERDSAEILSDYVGWLPGLTGVTGAPEETASAIRAFRVFARKVPLEGGDYTMDHSSSILMFNASGGFFGTIAYQAPHDEALGKIRGLLGG